MVAPDTAGDGDLGGDLVRVYWGCTTFQCARGFGGTEEDFPVTIGYCPECGGSLCVITVLHAPKMTTYFETPEPNAA